MTPQTAGHETHTLSATKRERVGSRHARRVRASGGLPAVLYGHKQQPLALTLEAHSAKRYILGGEKVFTIEVEGSTETALLKDIQYDYLGTEVIHIDLERVDLNEEVTTHLHLRFKGDPVGLKTAGSILVTHSTELEVRCKVSQILEHLDVDITDLDAHSSFPAGDVQLPEGYTLLTDEKSSLLTITAKAHEEEATDEAAEGEGEGAEPEVLTEKKEEGEEG
ncbi:MAG: 50S ribosomal protein L25 [Planctomycetota bacterium]|jgi:large subunit ribosomal protein L25